MTAFRQSLDHAKSIVHVANNNGDEAPGHQQYLDGDISSNSSGDFCEFNDQEILALDRFIKCCSQSLRNANKMRIYFFAGYGAFHHKSHTSDKPFNKFQYLTEHHHPYFKYGLGG